MSKHDWVKDIDGADVCDRDGCTVRRSDTGSNERWQKKRRSPWQSVLREPIPPCAGKDVDATPEAKAAHPTAPCRICGRTGGSHSAMCGLYQQSTPEAKSQPTPEEEPDDCAHGVHSWDGPAGRRECGECGTPKPADCICDFRHGKHRFSCATQGRSLPATRTEDGRMKIDVPSTPDAKSAILAKCDALDPIPTGQLATSNPNAPSPLEVVRKRLTDGIQPCMWRLSGEPYDCDPEPQGARCAFCKARDTVDMLLSTLEESIRSDEREKCADVADGRRDYHRKMQLRMDTDIVRSEQRAAADACADTAEFIRRRR